MEKEFAPYEESLELKELEFDEKCFAYYIEPSVVELLSLEKNIHYQQCYQNTSGLGKSCTTPTFSQAFRWFRKKHNIDGFVQIEPLNKKYGYVTYDREKGNYIESERKYTVEEAEIKCLKKLIQIVKNK